MLCLQVSHATAVGNLQKHRCQVCCGSLLKTFIIFYLEWQPPQKNKNTNKKRDTFQLSNEIIGISVENTISIQLLLMGNLLSTDQYWFQQRDNFLKEGRKTTGVAVCFSTCKLLLFISQQKSRSASQTAVPAYLHIHTQLSVSPVYRGASRHKEGQKPKTSILSSSFQWAVLTNTLANLSSSSPGSGMGSFRGMLWPLKSGCWSMLPAFPMIPPLWAAE